MIFVVGGCPASAGLTGGADQGGGRRGCSHRYQTVLAFLAQHVFGEPWRQPALL